MGNAEEKTIEERLAAEQKRLTPHLLACEGIRREVVEGVAAWLRPFWRGVTAHAVTEEVDVTERWTDGDLGRLKDELQALCDNAELGIEAFFRAPCPWWHLQTTAFPKMPQGNIRDIEEAIRLSAGRVAPILEAYGYLENQQHTWHDSKHPGVAYYRSALPWEELTGVGAMLERYRVAKDGAFAVFMAAEGLRLEQRRGEAKLRWESV